VEHSHIFDEMFARYVVDDRSAKQVVRGAEESLTIERAFHGAVATGMIDVDTPR